MQTQLESQSGYEEHGRLSRRDISSFPLRFFRLFMIVVLFSLILRGPMVSHVLAQGASGIGGGDNVPITNPVSVIDEAGKAISGFDKGLSPSINFLILLTVLSLAPSILIMTTCFTRFIIVLSLARQAMGTASLPPSQVLTGIALLLTFVVMSPTIQRIHDEAIVPYQQGDPSVSSQLDVWVKAKEPIREFMFNQIDASGDWSGVYMILEYRGYDISDTSKLTYSDVDMVTLIPAFIMNELKVAFLIGIRIYLPFLIIDMVIASLLISMGMLMLPPVLISLPFKLLLFVLVDGWHLIIGNLLLSVRQGPSPDRELYGSAISTVHQWGISIPWHHVMSGFI